MIVKGTRVYPDTDDPEEDVAHGLKAGEYCKQPYDGKWYAMAPGDHNLLIGLAGHKVEEHQDGTITVTPSIIVTKHDNDCKLQWHGYLTKGEWIDA